MTVPESSVSQPGASALPGSIAFPTAAEIDRSCRMAVLMWLASAAVWLVIGSLLAVITAIKAHAPGFLAGIGWLTYGRVRPASDTALLYGFVLQAGLGLGLWMICRLGRNVLAGRSILNAAAVLWNLGLVIGWCAILAGSGSGHEWFQLPPAVWPVLFCGSVLASSSALVNLHLRRERSLYVSQWFLMAGLLWFPWIFSTAAILLFYFPVRGVMQAIVTGWYRHNLYELCFAPFALAALFYFIPKLAGRPLHSRGLALFGFWLLVLFGGWGGVKLGEPVPSWTSSISLVSGFFILIPVLAFGLSWYGTFASGSVIGRSGPIGRFFIVAGCAYILAALLQAVGAHPVLRSSTLFTLYEPGVAQLKIHGFLIIGLAGAIYYVAPRIAGAEWSSLRLVQVHFWCALVGVTLIALSMLVGGVVQGAGINEPSVEFLRVVRRLTPFLGTSTLGTTLLLVGYGAFGWNLIRLIKASWRFPFAWSGLRPIEQPVLAKTSGGVNP